MSELYLFVAITLLGVAILLNMFIQPREASHSHLTYNRLHHEDKTPVARQGDSVELVLSN
jgi:hypothetical protein